MMARSILTSDRWLSPALTAAPETPLDKALARLPRRCRQAFLLSRLDECPYARISHQLGMPVERVEHALIEVLEGTRGEAGSREAVQWYVRLQSPSMTASARIDFRRWLDAAPEHLQAFHHTELHWRSLFGAAQTMAAREQSLRGLRKTSWRHCLAGLLTVLVLGLLALP
ncbi:DUF4880 domain-containing protein [Pseudomonas sp. NPDC007930]|uniref:DUF4880 domain-containing protein n=1 Tax=Pseudomonas sp. NPDC007930 TaxID=3364417 RepID=UPI0036E4AB71